MKHLAWDEGIINAAIVEVTGLDFSQDSTKTFCGKRVKMSHIDNKNYDCPRCRFIKLQETKAFKANK